MAQRRPFLHRLDANLLGALQAWAADDLRSVNGQVESLLRRALRDAGRQPRDRASSGAEDGGPVAPRERARLP
jgi:hypothetical protein